VSSLRPAMVGYVVLFFSTFQGASAFAANRAPSISGSPPTTATVGTAYYFKPTASDRDGNSLSFTIANKPGWTSFNTKTGALSGTPAARNVGVYPNIVIRVSDGKMTRSLNGFAITVRAGSSSTSNSPPKISGTPPVRAVVNQAYAFQPTASDPDGNTLKFSIANKPSWAAFSTTTGRLSGTPSSTSTGYWSNITISVSDGKATASLAPFAINVAAPSTADAGVVLSWKAPTKNTDGTTLTNLSGYRVYYGKQSGQYSQTLSLPNASLTSVSIEDLTSGTWYFAVKALAKDGDESSFSGQVSKKIP
jgi:Putative Ig domain